MTVAGAITRPFSPLARWIMRRMWWVEHAFERARASDKAVDDTRLRIFFVLALFAAHVERLGERASVWCCAVCRPTLPHCQALQRRPGSEGRHRY